MNIYNIMRTSTTVWFEPTENFWKFFKKLPWKYKHFHELGAGTGHLSRLMEERDFFVDAYDLFPRIYSETEVEQKDTTHPFDFSDLDCAIIARPCHGTGWIEESLVNCLDFGDAFYIGLEKNIKNDLPGFVYETVAKNVGHDGELLIRVYCLKKDAKELREVIVSSGRKEKWWYNKKTDRYTNSSHGLSGFYGKDGHVVKVLKKRKMGHDSQLYYTKKEMCKDDMDSGWIAPDGEWFGCFSKDHDKIATKVIGCPTARLESMGWIRCYGEVLGIGLTWSFGLMGYDQGHNPTSAQAKTLKKKGYKIRNRDLLADKDFPL